MVMPPPDVEIRIEAEANGGFAHYSVRTLREIADVGQGKRTGPGVAKQISADIRGADLYHLPLEIPRDQNRTVLAWCREPADQAVAVVAPYLDTIRELAQRGQDVDEATVVRLAEHTRRVVSAEVRRRVRDAVNETA